METLGTNLEFGHSPLRPCKPHHYSTKWLGLHGNRENTRWYIDKLSCSEENWLNFGVLINHVDAEEAEWASRGNHSRRITVPTSKEGKEVCFEWDRWECN